MGNTESTGDRSRDVYNAAKRGDANALRQLHAQGAGLEWRDAKGRTPLHVACQVNALACVAALLQLGADVHATSRAPDGVGTPLHIAVASQNEQLVSLLLQHGASPFVVHGEATPLDVATASNNAALVRKIESLGMFAGWLRLHRQPSTIVALLGGGRRPVMRWVVVVPRYRISSAGVLCKHQLRLFKQLSDASPISVWDVEAACLSQDRRAARVNVTVPGAGGGVAHARELVFLDGADSSRTPAHLMDACLNRNPPRVPPMPQAVGSAGAPQRIMAPFGGAPVPVAMQHQQHQPPLAPAATTLVQAFPRPPTTGVPPQPYVVNVSVDVPVSPHPPQMPPALPPRRTSQPQASNTPVSPEAQEAADLEEAIRRSLQQQQQQQQQAPPPPSSGAVPVSFTDAAPPGAGVPSAPPMPPSAAWAGPPPRRSQSATDAAAAQHDVPTGRPGTAPPPTRSAAAGGGHAAGAVAAAVAGDDTDDDDDDRLCVICLSERRTAGLLHGTSMHVCACSGCATRLQGGPCPICRAPVERVVQSIYS